MPDESTARRVARYDPGLIRTAVVTGALALGLLAGCNFSSSPLVAVFPVTRGGKVQYNVVAEDGTVFDVGAKNTPDHHLGFPLNEPIVDAVPRPGGGYWLVAADGGVFGFGGAPYKGNALGQHIVGMTPTPSGNGYWLVGSDGHVFNRGDAVHYNDLITAHIVPNQPVVGMAATPSGHGYWLVARDGGIFGFGDAGYHGNALGSAHPVVGMAAALGGYWIVAEDGGVFTSNNQHFYGGLGGTPPDNPVRHIAAAPDGHGYWLLEEHGKVHAFGSAKHYDPDVVFLASGPPGQFVFPVPNGQEFIEERTDRGQDFITNDNHPLLAMANGTVVETRNDPGGFGPCMVIIQMDQQYDIYPYLFYGHSKPNGNHCYVSPGQHVQAGQMVGIAGGTGSAGTPGWGEIGFLPPTRDVEPPSDCSHQTRSGIFMHDLLHQLKPGLVGVTPIKSCSGSD